MRLTGKPGPARSAILVVEITGSDIHWMEPRDLTLEEALAAVRSDTSPRISSHHISGVLYVDAEGKVKVIEEPITVEELRGLLTVDPDDPSIEKVPREGAVLPRQKP